MDGVSIGGLFATGDRWPFGDLTRSTYRVILADPPWLFKLRSEAGEEKSPQSQYDCMTLPAIQGLPVADLAHPDGCTLIVWCCAPMVPHALGTVAEWGFTYSTMGAWAKQSSTGAKWSFGTGYRYRSAAEFWIVATRGRPVQRVRDVRNLIVAPVREHSRKPDQMRTDLERLWAGPRCELFARRPSCAAWATWGNQTHLFTGEIDDRPV